MFTFFYCFLLYLSRELDAKKGLYYACTYYINPVNKLKKSFIRSRSLSLSLSLSPSLSLFPSFSFSLPQIQIQKEKCRAYRFVGTDLNGRLSSLLTGTVMQALQSDFNSLDHGVLCLSSVWFKSLPNYSRTVEKLIRRVTQSHLRVTSYPDRFVNVENRTLLMMIRLCIIY